MIIKFETIHSTAPLSAKHRFSRFARLSSAEYEFYGLSLSFFAILWGEEGRREEWRTGFLCGFQIVCELLPFNCIVCDWNGCTATHTSRPRSALSGCIWPNARCTLQSFVKFAQFPCLIRLICICEPELMWFVWCTAMDFSFWLFICAICSSSISVFLF